MSELSLEVKQSNNEFNYCQKIAFEKFHRAACKSVSNNKEQKRHDKFLLAYDQ
jgi:hypothetical protein